MKIDESLMEFIRNKKTNFFSWEDILQEKKNKKKKEWIIEKKKKLIKCFRLWYQKTSNRKFGRISSKWAWNIIFADSISSFYTLGKNWIHW